MFTRNLSEIVVVYVLVGASLSAAVRLAARSGYLQLERQTWLWPRKDGDVQISSNIIKYPKCVRMNSIPNP